MDDQDNATTTIRIPTALYHAILSAKSSDSSIVEKLKSVLQSNLLSMQDDTHVSQALVYQVPIEPKVIQQEQCVAAVSTKTRFLFAYFHWIGSLKASYI